MKNILIAGANSYLGTSFENYMKKFSDGYLIETVDMVDGSWRNKDFSPFDVVYLVAGISHIKETSENARLYYKVNRDLIVEVAEKAKVEGVKQIIFLSSMSVYGKSEGEITEQTIPIPVSNYGKSKYQAEEKLINMSGNNFFVAVLRLPVVYGKGCKGSYQTLSKWAKRMPVFPKVNNTRSMLFVDNLSAFVKKLIDKKAQGYFYPQNREYVCVSEMVREIACADGQKIWITSLFNPFVKIGIRLGLSYFTKAFGNLVYTYRKDSIDEVDFKTSVKMSERGGREAWKAKEI
ncbi:MAG: UDP-galactose-4-epimerase [Firmicutes bacterium ADurb.Bin300]|nr:MAG: UDP-galactose-4-epimerase [Firmicutes bacterium ADurb.Bin300]